MDLPFLFAVIFSSSGTLRSYPLGRVQQPGQNHGELCPGEGAAAVKGSLIVHAGQDTCLIEGSHVGPVGVRRNGVAERGQQVFPRNEAMTAAAS